MNKPDSVSPPAERGITAISLEMIVMSIRPPFGRMPANFGTQVCTLKRTIRRLQQVGLPVSPSLVSAALKSCHFKICSKPRLVR